MSLDIKKKLEDEIQALEKELREELPKALKTAAALGDTQIALPGSGNRFARLRDIANVHDGVGEIRTISRLNGRDATTFGAANSIGYRRDDVAARRGQFQAEDGASEILIVYTGPSFREKPDARPDTGNALTHRGRSGSPRATSLLADDEMRAQTASPRSRL